MFDHLQRLGGGLAAFTVLAAIAGPAVPAMAATSAKVLLRADSNRNGRLTPADDAARDTWTTTRGAIMLPNNAITHRDNPAAWGAVAFMILL